MTSPPSWQPKQWKNAARRGDVERRGLLVVERAEALLRAAAGVAQRDVLRRRRRRCAPSRAPPRCSPPGSGLPRGESRSGRTSSSSAGHDVHRLLAGREPVQLVADQPVARAATSRCSRRRRAARSAGPGAVQSGLSPAAARGRPRRRRRVIRPVSQRRDQGVGDHDRAAGDVDQERAVLHPGQEAPRRPGPRVSSVSGTTSTTTSAVGQQVGQLVDRRVRRRGPSARPAPPRPRRARSRRLDRLADRAVPDDQHPLVGQRRPPARAPLAPRPGARTKLGYAAQRRPGSGSARARRSRCRGCRGRCTAVTPSRHVPAGCCRRPAVSVWTTRSARHPRQHLADRPADSGTAGRRTRPRHRSSGTCSGRVDHLVAQARQAPGPSSQGSSDRARTAARPAASRHAVTADETWSCQVTAEASVSEATWSITTRSRAGVVGGRRASRSANGGRGRPGRGRAGPRPARRAARAAAPSGRPGPRPA